MVTEIRLRSRVRVRLGSASDWKTFSVDPTVNGYFFRISIIDKAANAGWLGSDFHMQYQAYSGPLTL